MLEDVSILLILFLFLILLVVKQHRIMTINPARDSEASIIITNQCENTAGRQGRHKHEQLYISIQYKCIVFTVLLIYTGFQHHGEQTKPNLGWDLKEPEPR